MTFSWKSGIILVGYSKRGQRRLLYPKPLYYIQIVYTYFKPFDPCCKCRLLYLKGNSIKDFIKIDDSLYNDLGDDVVSTLKESVKNQLAEEMDDENFEHIQELFECESPIEQMMSLALHKELRNAEIPSLLTIIDIDRQAEIKCKEKTYRVDFLIPVIYWNKSEWLVVECDGYEFHQKTEEQVERDNIRTRILQREGYTVIRFSGTEVYKKPYQCAREVRKIIQAPALKFLEKIEMIDEKELDRLIRNKKQNSNK